MTSFWEAKYSSAEKSIEFLQAQHTQTLQSLHEQIETLQKQCADLSFKLSVQAPTLVEKEEFEKQHKSFNNDLKRKDNIIQEQLKSLDEKNKTIKTFQERIRTLEKRLEVDTRLKDETIKQLKQQTDQQSAQIAQLMFQIHSFNQNKMKSTTQSIVSIQSPRSSNEKVESRIKNKFSSSLSSSSSTELNSSSIFHDRSDKLLTDTNKVNLLNDKIDVLIATASNIKEMPGYGNSLSSTKASNNNLKRQTSASSTSSENEKPHVHTKPLKALPLQEIRTKFGIVPDPKPFLQNSLSNTEISSEINLPKRPTGALPPIRVPAKFSKIVVDSPHKPTTNTIINSSPDVQSNNQ